MNERYHTTEKASTQKLIGKYFPLKPKASGGITISTETTHPGAKQYLLRADVLCSVRRLLYPAVDRLKSARRIRLTKLVSDKFDQNRKKNQKNTGQKCQVAFLV